MVFVSKVEDIPLEPMDCPDHGEKLGLRVLVDPLLNVGIRGLSMVQTEIEPGGHTKFHEHTFEHIHFIFEGKSLVETEEKQYTVTSPTVLAFPSGAKHRQRNIGDTILKIIEVNVPATPKEFWHQLGYFKDK